MSFDLQCIVEGDGDVDALPVLVRRVNPVFRCARPIRVPKSKLLKPGELERYAHLAASRITRQTPGGVLLVIDADDDCPKILAPELAARLRGEIGHVPSQVVLACREYESWFIAGIDNAHLSAVADSESTRDAKSVVRQCFKKYSETIDQPRLSEAIDVQRARQRSRSFRRLCHALELLVNAHGR